MDAGVARATHGLGQVGHRAKIGAVRSACQPWCPHPVAAGRGSRHFSGDPFTRSRGRGISAELLLDPGRARAERDDRLRRLNTRTIPLIRLMGWQLLIVGAVLHNALLLDAPDWGRVLWFAAFIEAYALAAWAVLARWYAPRARLDLGMAFLVLDLLPLAATVYITGADRSWLFWIVLLRVSDQSTSYFGRALLFTHLATLAYLAVVGYVVLVEGRAVDWPPELAKAAFLYAGGLYVSTAARPATRVRHRLREAVAAARDAASRLSAQSAELERARAEAESASQAKSQFLSRVSHELRTPMNAILGFAQLLDMEELEEEHRAHVAEILEGGRHLLDIINEVMDIARVETGALASELRPVAMRPALTEVLDHARAAARAREVRLPDEIPASCDAWVLAHERKLRQVIANLLSNAIKYNRAAGSVEIACRRMGGRLRVSITDMGTGIAHGEMDAAFTPFVRLESARGTGRGTGLGLPLARSLVQAMNGRLDVDSHPGEGSTFWFELPLADEEEATAASEPADAPSEAASADPWRRVLYVDDKPENVTLVRRILDRRPGVELITAVMGAEGLELARSHRPDLILLDLELPDISGDEVFARLRADAETRGIPVVVVSAEASPERVDRLLAAGARAYFTMPYDVVGFLETVDELLTSG